MLRVLVASVLLFAAGCGHRGAAAPGAPVDVRVVLGPGQTATIDQVTAIRFERVNGDSRCPADALCIWGGDAIVLVSVIGRVDAIAYELHTATERPVTHDDLTIALEQLQPYPFSGRPIDPADYRATLHITR